MKILVTGGGGMLARAIGEEFGREGHDVHLLRREQLDVTVPKQVAETLEQQRPDAVIHCAAYTQVDRAEVEESEAWRVNALGTLHVALACRQTSARMVYISTDYVFSGLRNTPYLPDDKPDPINAYGRSKWAGEVAARAAEDYLIIRTSWLYGAGGKNFVSAILAKAQTGTPLRVVDDQIGSPTWTPQFAEGVCSLLEAGVSSGTYHLTGGGRTSWYILAAAVLKEAGLGTPLVPVGTQEFSRAAQRPSFSVLDCSGTEAIVGPLPQWQESLKEAIRGQRV